MADSNVHMAQWLPSAEKLAVEGNPLSTPYDIFLRETSQLIEFIRTHWSKDGARPGLEGNAKRLPKPDDMMTKLRAVQEAQTELLLAVDPTVIAKGERARFLLDELESVLEYVLDDGKQEPADDQLAQIKEFHSQDGQRSSALSQSLRDYAALSRLLIDRIKEEDSNFDVALIEEAEALSVELAKAPRTPPSTGSKAATKRRNQLIALLLADVTSARSVARHTFRRFPDILREVGSVYERRRRAANRRAQLEAEEAAKKKDPEGKPENL